VLYRSGIDVAGAEPEGLGFNQPQEVFSDESDEFAMRAGIERDLLVPS
jgi:hypothetical protein